MNGMMEGNILKAPLSGHIDSANAPAVEAGIMQLRESCPHEGLILDLKDLTYISSAGLRMVLRLGKLEPSFRLINASPEVYEILDITGFTEMFSVERLTGSSPWKAARRSDRGRTASCTGSTTRLSLRFTVIPTVCPM